MAKIKGDYLMRVWDWILQEPDKSFQEKCQDWSWHRDTHTQAFCFGWIQKVGQINSKEWFCALDRDKRFSLNQLASSSHSN